MMHGHQFDANLQAVNALQSCLVRLSLSGGYMAVNYGFNQFIRIMWVLFAPLFVPHLVSLCEMTSSPRVYIINNPNIDFQLAVTRDPSIHDSERSG